MNHVVKEFLFRRLPAASQEHMTEFRLGRAIFYPAGRISNRGVEFPQAALSKEVISQEPEVVFYDAADLPLHDQGEN